MVWSKIVVLVVYTSRLRSSNSTVYWCYQYPPYHQDSEYLLVLLVLSLLSILLASLVLFVLLVLFGIVSVVPLVLLL